MDLKSFLFVLVLDLSWLDNIVYVTLGDTCDYVLERDDVGLWFEGKVHLGSCLSLDFHHELVERVDLLLLYLLQRRHLLVVFLLVVDALVLTQLIIVR